MGAHGREDCRTCKGDGELSSAGTDFVTHAFNVRRRTTRLYEAGRITLSRVRDYMQECAAFGWDPRTDSRIVLCLDTVRAYRLSIKYQRSTLRAKAHEQPAWCRACRAIGLEHVGCECCGEPVDRGTLNEEALELVDILVHKTCDTGDAFFDHHPAQSTQQSAGAWR